MQPCQICYEAAGAHTCTHVNSPQSPASEKRARPDVLETSHLEPPQGRAAPLPAPL